MPPSDASVPAEECPPIAGGPAIIPSDIVILVDRSAAMKTPTESGKTYLDAVEEALDEFVSLPYTQHVSIALSYFPPSDNVFGSDAGTAHAACDAPFALDVGFGEVEDNAAFIRQSLAAQTPVGTRPLGPALEGALSIARARAATENHPTHVIAISSGPPDACEPRSLDGLAMLTSAFPRVGVSAIALGSNLFEKPDGASPPFHSAVIDGEDLSGQILRRLLEATGNVAPCDIEIPPPPQAVDSYDWQKINVWLRPYGGSASLLYYVEDATGCAETGGEGWYYDDPASPSRILLCDASCARTPGAELEVVLGCPRHRHW